LKISHYIYQPDQSLDVYKKTKEYFIENPEIKRRIEELGWIYQTVGTIVPQNLKNLWSGHFFPFLESKAELQISFTLCCFGLYKQAFVSLRSGLELGLLSVYYNINDEGHETIKDWFNSKDSFEANTPRADKIWNILLSNSNIKKFNEKHNLKELFEQFSYLHNYVHSKGYAFSNRVGLDKANFQTFEPQLFEKWFNSYSKVVSLITTLHLIKYPISVIRYDYSIKFGIEDIPSFGGLDEYYIDKIAKILPSGYMKDIEDIAQNDYDTQQIIKGIDSLPDLSDDDIEEQIINLDKFSIENDEGYIKWLENQKADLKQLGVNDFDGKMKTRIKILEAWATKKGFLKSKIERL